MTARRTLLGGIAAVGLAVCVVLLASGGGAYTAVVELKNAAGLRKDSSVRVAGAIVGHVEKLSVTRSDRVLAQVQIDSQAAPIGRNARAVVRSANLFGEKFLDIRPGDLKHPLPSGAVIPLSRTSEPVEIDDLLDVLDRDTRARLAILLNEAGAAFAGRQADFNAAINALPNTLDDTGRLVREFAADNRALGDLVSRSDRVLQTLAPQRKALGQLIATAHGALAGFASRRPELGSTVERAAPTIVELRRALIRIERLAVPLRPAARELRASSPQLAGTLRELPSFADAASPTLAAAKRTSPSLARLGRVATPVLRGLVPTTDALQRFSHSLAPVTQLLDTSGPDVLGFLEGWARLTQVRDGLGHMFRNSFIMPPGLISSAVSVRQAPGASGRTRRNPAPVPAGDPPRPASSHRPQIPLPKLPKVPLPKQLRDVPKLEAPAPQRALDRLLDYLLAP